MRKTNVNVRHEVPTMEEIKCKMRNEVPFEYEEREVDYEDNDTIEDNSKFRRDGLSKNKSSVVKVFVIVVIAFAVLIT